MRRVGFEARKADRARRQNGFYDKFLTGPNILDIGYGGHNGEAEPISSHAIGVDLDYPSYDGLRLPFQDQSQDAVFVSHCLQYIEDHAAVLKEWYRVLKTGGHLLIFVPHKYLYERRPVLPSRWSGGGHKRFYTPSVLLQEIDAALPLNGFRIRHFAENDLNFDYMQSVCEPPRGCYEIEIVIQKIVRPTYSDRLELSSAQAAVHQKVVETLRDRILALIDTPEAGKSFATTLTWIPSYTELRAAIMANRQVSDGVIKAALLPLLDRVQVNNDWYLSAYPDIKLAIEKGDLSSARDHFVSCGYFEGRMADDIYGTFLDSATNT